ncbi:hypothetical protein DBV05_g10261 [Lasiodiplodia theobromae]|uniref:Ig-like domain-containing protein n=1 Tax=Lasiodiplodia theobromae TaxID=45133 RepID=A0A5N5D089_9PEZI|nr:hypothetical protein DBV05_g10261 [Lasiodiplodia theobromae]
MRHTFPLITLAGAGVMAQSSSTATNSILTTSFYFPSGANVIVSPVASIIGINDTFTDIVTYLIKCAPPSLSASTSVPASTSASASATTTPAPTTTAPLDRRTSVPSSSSSSSSSYTYSPETWDDDAYGDYYDDDNSSNACVLPDDGETLVAGPSTMSLSYALSGTTADADCSITWGSGSASASASATAASASASATATAGADARCYMYDIDPAENYQIVRNAFYPDADESNSWPTLLITAGLEKLEAAKATDTMDLPTITGSTDTSSSTGTAAAVRFDIPTAIVAP